MLSLLLVVAASCTASRPNVPEPEPAPGVVHAAEQPPPPAPDVSGIEPSRQGSLSLFFANDLFADNDDGYTAGFGAVWTTGDIADYAERNLIRKCVSLLSFLPTVGNEGYRNYFQVAFGWELYTPKDISTPDPPPGSDPYAGVVFLDSTVFSRSRDAMHAFTLRLGFVGPGAGGREIQTWIHERTGSPVPQGWDTQLGNEPLLNLDYGYFRRLLRNTTGRLDYDLEATAAGGFGNYFIGALGGLQARLGVRLPHTLGAVPALGRYDALVGLPSPERRFFLYVFADAQVIVTARFLPIDGNTFRASRSGQRDDLTGTVTTGLVVGYGRLLLTWSFTLIGSPVQQSGSRDDFGTVSLSFHFG